jgi:ParB family transcriptional regulator, chromosome partitioning protein
MAGNKLTAKAARLDFSSLPAMSPPAGADPSHRPKTAPGAMMAFANDARSDLLRENEDLRLRASEADSLRGKLGEALNDLSQWDGAKATRLIDPKAIVPSAFANRHEASYQGADYLALRQEIENAGGNVQPIKVRALRGEPSATARYELVFGHRRHRACLELGLPVLAVIDNLDDRALFVEMERENRARKDLSAWEQGQMYRRALTQGLFASNRKLAEAVGVDLSALGKALALADLPDAVVQAFPSPLVLQFRWARPLAEVWGRHPQRTLARAKSLAGQRGQLGARAVFDALVADEGRGVEPFHPPVPESLQLGERRVGELRAGDKGGVVIVLDPGVLSADRQLALARWIERFLQGKD